MRPASALVTAAIAAIPYVSAAAADFDGHKPFLCATVDVASCEPGRQCERTSAEAVNAPQFFTVDIAKKIVIDTDADSPSRTSTINHVEHLRGSLVAGGDDGELAWVATVNEQTGKMSVAAVGNGLSVVIFGACIAR